MVFKNSVSIPPSHNNFRGIEKWLDKYLYRSHPAEIHYESCGRIFAETCWFERFTGNCLILNPVFICSKFIKETPEKSVKYNQSSQWRQQNDVLFLVSLMLNLSMYFFAWKYFKYVRFYFQFENYEKFNSFSQS